MKQTIRYMLARLTAFVLTAALLTGCALPGIGPRPTDETDTTVSQDYEAYTEASLLLQKKFDQLTDHLFREEVVKSAIDKMCIRDSFTASKTTAFRSSSTASATPESVTFPPKYLLDMEMVRFTRFPRMLARSEFIRSTISSQEITPSLSKGIS